MRCRFAKYAIPLLIGCSGLPSPEERGSLRFAWPSEDPRVELDRVIAEPRDFGRRSILRMLAGAKETGYFVRPHGVALGADSLFVTDAGTARVTRVDSRGQAIRSEDGLFEIPMGIALCGTELLVTDSRAGKVAVLDSRLNLVRWFAQDLDRPTGVACTSRNQFIVETGKHRVLMFSSEGLQKVIGKRGKAAGEFNFPSSITNDGENLWVGDTLNFRVQRISIATGEVSRVFGTLGDSPGEMPRIKGLAMDSDGHLWISDAHVDTVSIYDGDGQFLMYLGGPGSGPGQFSFAAGIAADNNGTVAVVDSLNRRVQVFRLMPRTPQEKHSGSDQMPILSTANEHPMPASQ